MFLKFTVGILVASVICCAEARAHSRFDADHNNHVQVDRSPLIYKNDKPVKSIAPPSPPPPAKVAQMARYIVHTSEWGGLSYISSEPETAGYPVAGIFSLSDGEQDNSTGVPFLYVTSMETPIKDLLKDPRASLAMSLAQGTYCTQKGLDPQDPPCAQVVLTGKMERLKKGTTDWAFAKRALFSRHPNMSHWPTDHKFFFMKLNINKIVVQDYYGGPQFVKVDDYFKVKL